MGIFSGKRPADLGLDESGKLKPCPDKPNCVCSQVVTAEDKQHQIAAIDIHIHPEKAIHRLITTLARIKGIHIITVSKGYLYAECTTPIMGFVDDLEFSLDREMKIWHVRSASRLGTSDFGKNHHRVEQIRQLLNE